MVCSTLLVSNASRAAPLLTMGSNSRLKARCADTGAGDHAVANARTASDTDDTAGHEDTLATGHAPSASGHEEGCAACKRG